MKRRAQAAWSWRLVALALLAALSCHTTRDGHPRNGAGGSAPSTSSGGNSGQGGAQGEAGTAGASLAGAGGAGLEQGAALDSLIFSAGEFNPRFSADVLEYSLQLTAFDSAVLQVLASSSHADATLTVAGAKEVSGAVAVQFELAVDVGPTALTIDVQAPGLSGRRYVISLERASIDQAQALELELDGHAWDEHGAAVAAGREWAAIGGPKDDVALDGVAAFADDDFGSVRVLRVSALGETDEEARLGADADVRGGNFGSSLSAHGDLLLVGAPGESAGTDSQLPQAGAAYLFAREAGVWRRAQRLTAPAAESSASFGAQVALHADTLAVSVPGEGQIDLFQRSADEWTHEKRLSLDGGTPTALALSEERLVVAVQDTCGVVVYEKGAGRSWSETCLSAGWPRAVAVQGEVIALGYDNSVSFLWRLGSSWVDWFTELTRPSAPGFGAQLVFDKDRLFVAAPGDPSAARGINGNESDQTLLGSPSGAVFAFRLLDGLDWQQVAYLKPLAKADAEVASAGFGSALACSGGTVVVGAKYHDASVSAPPPSSGTSPVAGEPSGTAFVYR